MPEDWFVADWLADARLAVDWPVVVEEPVVPGVLVVVVSARVTVVMKALWLSVSSRWCR